MNNFVMCTHVSRLHLHVPMGNTLAHVFNTTKRIDMNHEQIGLVGLEGHSLVPMFESA